MTLAVLFPHLITTLTEHAVFVFGLCWSLAED